MRDSLLVEILTEELPPKSLQRLSAAFGAHLFQNLRDQGFVATKEAQTGNHEPYINFATPRRLAVLIPDVDVKQPNRIVERKGPAIIAGYDAQGNPTPALKGFAKSCGVEISALARATGDKGEYFIFRSKQKGSPLKDLLAGMVEASLKKLPAHKLMRWGDNDAQFVRPAHGLMMLHGPRIIPGRVLGITSGRKTFGHRFLSRGTLTIAHANQYEKILKKTGKVVASFAARRADIEAQLRAAASKIKKGAFVLFQENKVADIADPGLQEITQRNTALLDEVTALVEWPKVYIGAFNKEFLEVPAACLGLSMQQHQRYFPLIHAKEGMLPHFLVVSNIDTKKPDKIIRGNERVLRARLSDARFFFEQDKKIPLEQRVPKLSQVVYHNKLGSQLDRVKRLKQFAPAIAERLGLDSKEQEYIKRAAYLCKADLLTNMVGEFPELQGEMGALYAKSGEEPQAVVWAIGEHYTPRFAGDRLPGSPGGVCLALADKLDALAGIYGAGEIPSGDKDPFGLRRQALGIIRILLQGWNEQFSPLPLDIRALLDLAYRQFPPGVLSETGVGDLYSFILERLKPYLREQGFLPDEIDAVLSLNLTRLDDIWARLTALQPFRNREEGMALAAANKRIRNILRQAGNPSLGEIDPHLLQEDAEKKLAQELALAQAQVQPLFQNHEYGAALSRLADLHSSVTDFFDKVMVIAEDQALRQNRLALLNKLMQLFLGIADISRLQIPG